MVNWQNLDVYLRKPLKNCYWSLRYKQQMLLRTKRQLKSSRMYAGHVGVFLLQRANFICRSLRIFYINRSVHGTTGFFGYTVCCRCLCSIIYECINEEREKQFSRYSRCLCLETQRGRFDWWRLRKLFKKRVQPILLKP